MSDNDCEHIALSRDVYDPAAVLESAQAYVALLHVDVLRSSPDETEVSVRRSQDGPGRAHVLGEFLNHVLDLSIRRKLGLD
jgi:hypothetical protein